VKNIPSFLKGIPEAFVCRMTPAYVGYVYKMENTFFINYEVFGHHHVTGKHLI